MLLYIVCPNAVDSLTGIEAFYQCSFVVLPSGKLASQYYNLQSQQCVASLWLQQVN